MFRTLGPQMYRATREGEEVQPANGLSPLRDQCPAQNIPDLVMDC